MTKIIRTFSVFLISISLLLSGCANSPKIEQNDSTQNATTEQTSKDNTGTTQPSPSTTTVEIDYSQVKPNEAGKVMVVMFHNFVESFTAKKSDDGAYTTTFDAFGKLLQDLYTDGYRLVNLNDYINNNISVPAGFKPMVFTFDDGTAGQFNLVDDGGKLTANKQSAVGIMEEFNRTHPDFGLKGTFYVNLGNSTFEGKGTLPERLKYLIDKGFEVGNHTYTHIMLSKVESADKIQQEIGENQKKISELVPGYIMNTFSLPYGLPSKALQGYVAKGEYQGVKYDNKGIMEVGWDPNVSPVSKSFNPLSIHRVRASGIKPVDADLAWWLKSVSKNDQYVSDGNPDTIAVPKSKETNVDQTKLNGKKLVIY